MDCFFIVQNVKYTKIENNFSQSLTQMLKYINKIEMRNDRKKQVFPVKVLPLMFLMLLSAFLTVQVSFIVKLINCLVYVSIICAKAFNWSPVTIYVLLIENLTITPKSS